MINFEAPTISFNEIAERLLRFCGPALFFMEDPVLDVSKIGSAFQCRYHGRNLVLLTRHQLGTGIGKLEPSQFIVALDEPDSTRLGMSPTVIYRPKMGDPDHANLEDLLLLEYEDHREGRDLRELFLTLDDMPMLSDFQPEAIMAIFAIGYPTQAGTNELHWDEEGNLIGYHMHFRWVTLFLATTERASLDTENRIPLVQDPRAAQETIEPDGMSGAPAFFVAVDQGQTHFGFAGLITNAKPGRYMLYDAAVIRKILDRSVASDHDPSG